VLLQTVKSWAINLTAGQIFITARERIILDLIKMNIQIIDFIIFLLVRCFFIHSSNFWYTPHRIWKSVSPCIHWDCIPLCTISSVLFSVFVPQYHPCLQGRRFYFQLFCTFSKGNSYFLFDKFSKRFVFLLVFIPYHANTQSTGICEEPIELMVLNSVSQFNSPMFTSH